MAKIHTLNSLFEQVFALIGPIRAAILDINLPGVEVSVLYTIAAQLQALLRFAPQC
jgi:hypothetical protein